MNSGISTLQSSKSINLKSMVKELNLYASFIAVIVTLTVSIFRPIGNVYTFEGVSMTIFILAVVSLYLMETSNLQQIDLAEISTLEYSMAFVIWSILNPQLWVLRVFQVGIMVVTLILIKNSLLARDKTSASNTVIQQERKYEPLIKPTLKSK